MNEKTFRILEYDKIIHSLSEKASSSLGKKMCLELKPSTNAFEVREWLSETAEAFEIVLKWGSLPLTGLKDIGEIVKRAGRGFVLSPGDLLGIGDILRCCRRLKTFMKDGEKKELYPIVYEIVDSLEPIKALEEEIERVIVSEEEIADRASEKLFGIRREIKTKNARIKEKLSSMVQSYSKYLQDPIVTIRGDRYVIPVKAECKSSVPGLVHDQSSSGSTLFIEPMAVVELNNDLRELMLKEKDEIERILAELSGKVAEHENVLEHNNYNVSYLDFLMSKAKYGLDINAIVPDVNESGRINIKAARHPLIDSKKVVPIDIRLGDTFNALVITGPNTGGKTVTLKTAGLLTLMAMAGLGIPARDGSVVSVFDSVYADIGDEQSIEQSLSTFSSHMTNIVDILKKAGHKSMVLVDELGAGTDPTEGAALAMSILQKLHDKGTRLIATTHYSEIKVFAMEKPGFENASVEFDVETLRPTYRLLIGIPGKSNAFDISKRLGLSDEIINEARSMVSKDAVKFEDVIQSLQNKTMSVEKELDEIRRQKAEIETLKKELSGKKYKLESEKDKIIRKSQEEARKLVKEAKDEADEILKELVGMKMKAGESVSVKEAEEKRKKLGNKLKDMEVVDEDTLDIKDGMIAADSVGVGDEVFVTTLSQKGTVLSEPDAKGEVQIQIGSMKININVSKLMKSTKPKKEARKVSSMVISREKVRSVSSSIDLRGQNIEEAMFNIDKYLDDAYLANIETVTIIHGKGTGALREGIQSELRKNRYVKSIRMGDIHEGGSGVTVVEIKK